MEKSQCDVLELVEKMMTKFDSHIEQLRSAELTRLVFLNIIELIGVRFVPDHERVVELIRGATIHDDFNKLSGTFSSTWPSRDKMPKEASVSPVSPVRDNANESMTFPSLPVRTGGGYSCQLGQRSPSSSSIRSRPSSASTRRKSKLRSMQVVRDSTMSARDF